MSLSEGLRFQDKKKDREMKDREMRNNEVSRWKGEVGKERANFLENPSKRGFSWCIKFH